MESIVPQNVNLDLDANFRTALMQIMQVNAQQRWKIDRIKKPRNMHTKLSN